MNAEPEEKGWKGKMLVVDDEENICRLLAQYFEKKHYEVLEAYNGEQALAIARQEKPRFVLLDYQMPGLDGLDVLASLKEMDPEIVVIMMTGIDDEAVFQKARDLGVYSFLMKPLDFQYLETLLITKLI